MKRLTPIAISVVLALVLASCGGDDAADTTTSTPTSTTTSTTSTTRPTTTTSSTTTTVPSNQPSATATTVVVQQDLTALGYYEGDIDGIAGAETSAAIAKFQADEGLEADGEFGPQTDEAMYPLLQEDQPYVEGVQEDLTELDFYSGPIDGDYGKGTRAAVERLQVSCDLEETGELEIDTRVCLLDDQ